MQVNGLAVILRLLLVIASEWVGKYAAVSVLRRNYKIPTKLAVLTDKNNLSMSITIGSSLRETW